MKCVIIERGGQYEAHKKNLNFHVRGPCDATYICTASTRDKCRAILLSEAHNINSVKFKIVEELDI